MMVLSISFNCLMARKRFSLWGCSCVLLDGTLTNSDTIPDYRDIDSDNDGIPDNIEAQTTTGYVAPSGTPGDNGLDDAYDFTDSFASTGLSTTLIDTDGDVGSGGDYDYREVDADGDGTNDDAEGRTGSPAFAGADTDGDGLDNGYDNVDTTGGVFDVNDNIADPEVAGLIDVDGDVSTGGDVDYRDTLTGTDTDGDGIVDTIDIDDDNDGILDTVEGEASDFDGDGIVNSLDMDSDGDGILDNVEAQTSIGFTAPPTTGIEAAVGANGLFSIYENNDTAGATGLTPNITTATDTTPDYLDIDTDDDGIPDNVEAQTTTGYTAPSGTIGLNGVDVNYENNDTFTATGLDPNNHDGTDEPDYRDTDSDNDTASDADESGITLNAGVLGTDSDSDGLDDIYEGSNATAGEAYDVNDEIDDPVNNLEDLDDDGATTGDVDYRDDLIFIDTDGDGVGDDVDLDDDNDGILDDVEVFSINDLSPQLWLDATDYNGNRTTYSDGTLLSTDWIDKSGNGNHYSLVSGPTYQTSEINGKAVVEILDAGFNGPVGAATSTSEWTVVMVTKLLPSDTNGRLFEGHTGNYLLGYHGGRKRAVYFEANPSALSTVNGTTAGVTDFEMNIYVRSASGVMNLYSNGNTLNSYSSTTSTNGIIWDINQGKFRDSESSDSQIGDFIIIPTALTEEDRQKLEGYFCLLYTSPSPRDQA